MHLSKRKRNLIIRLVEAELKKRHKSKSLNKELRSIATRMKASILDTKITESMEGK